MSRIHTFLTILLVFTVAVVIHLVGVSLFPMMDGPLDHENGDTFNQDEVQDDIATTISVWVPLIMSGGTVVWGFAKEFRRQKDTAVTGRVR